MISITNVKRKIMSIAEIFHLHIFGHNMSDAMREFIGHLSWSFFGGFIAAGIMFAVNVFAGRILGPLEFGKYNYVLSLVTAMTFFFLLGNNNSSIRYISDKKYADKKGSFLGALIFLTIFQAIIIFLIISFTKNIIAGNLNLDNEAVYFVFFLAFIFSFKELFDSFIRSFELFKNQSFAKVIDAIVVLTTFLLSYTIFRHKIDYTHYAIAMAVGATFSIFYFFYLIKNYFKKFSKEEIKTIFHYNKFLIIGGLSGLIMSLEKVFIGKYIGMESLGIYSAYYASSHMVVSNIGILFINIFWPAIVKNKDNMKPVIDKISKICFRYFPIWLVINFSSVFIFMLFYGNQYATSPWLVLLFSTSSITNIFFFVFMNFMNIDRISATMIINAIIYVILISSIAIFRSIPVYLIIQILIYLIGVMYVRKILLHDAMKKI